MMSRTLPSIGAILRPATAAQPVDDRTSEPATPTRQPTKAPASQTLAREPEVMPKSVSPTLAPDRSVPRVWDVTSANQGDNVDETVYLVPRQVYLPRSTHAQAKAYAAESGIPVTEMIVTALSDMHAALPAFLRQERMRDDASAAGELYAIPQRARRNRNPDRQVQTSIRVTDQQLIVMDDLATRHGVNRSKLLAICLQMWLADRAPNAAPG